MSWRKRASACANRWKRRCAGQSFHRRSGTPSCNSNVMPNHSFDMIGSLRRQVEDEFATKLETQARLLEAHYNQQLEAMSAARGTTSSGARHLEGELTERLNERAEELERLMTSRYVSPLWGD